MAANSDGKKIKLVIVPDDKNKQTIGKLFTVPAYGWNHFNDIIWSNVHLDNGGYGLQVYFVTGRTNLCSAAVYASHGQPAPSHKPSPMTHPPVPVP